MFERIAGILGRGVGLDPVLAKHEEHAAEKVCGECAGPNLCFAEDGSNRAERAEWERDGGRSGGRETEGGGNLRERERGGGMARACTQRHAARRPFSLRHTRTQLSRTTHAQSSGTVLKMVTPQKKTYAVGLQPDLRQLVLCTKILELTEKEGEIHI